MPKHLSDREYQKLMNSPDVQRACDAKANEIVAGTRRRIRQVTGATAASVAVERAVRDDGVLVRRVGYDLDVDVNGPYYEFGTEDTPARAPLRTAARAAD